jgi:formylglycine-generating enzyme required for sulfatase activity
VSLLADYGWIAENSAGKRPQSSASNLPGLGGLHDVQGNLFEWVHDLYGEFEGGGAVAELQSTPRGKNRVLRGGGWDSDAANCRLAFRGRLDPTLSSSNLGFRLALSPSASPPEASGEQEKASADQ